MQFRAWLEAIQSNYDDLTVRRIQTADIPDGYDILDSKTRGRAFVVVKQHWNDEKVEYGGDAVVILRWDAAPFSAIAMGGLAATEKYKGGGFARNAMRKILEIAQERNIKILEIFAPSDDSQAVMTRYVQKGVLTPIPYSKAALADFHTAFHINRYTTT